MKQTKGAKKISKTVLKTRLKTKETTNTLILNSTLWFLSQATFLMIAEDLNSSIWFLSLFKSVQTKFKFLSFFFNFLSFVNLKYNIFQQKKSQIL
jgi:hypothetical protein